jgi:hypothetical protein
VLVVRCIVPSLVLGVCAFASPAAVHADFIGDPAAAPTLRIASAPPACCAGAWAGTLAGTIANADPTATRIVVYAHTDIWYVQPYAGCCRPLVEPGAGGDVYAALLVDAGWTPPATCSSLPQGAAVLACSDSQTGLRRIEFASRTLGRERGQPLVAAGPGPNYWGGANDQVWVDAAGGLHLRVSAHDGRWEAAEVYSEGYVGYGRIRFHGRGAGAPPGYRSSCSPVSSTTIRAPRWTSSGAAGEMPRTPPTRSTSCIRIN